MHRHLIVIALLVGTPAMAAAADGAGQTSAPQKPAIQKPAPAKPAPEKPAVEEPAAAEEEAGPSVLVIGAISTAASQLDNDTNSAKLTEYRDLADRAYIPNLRLNVVDTRNGRFAEFYGANVSLRDQSLFGRPGVAGLWRAGVDWNDIPHNYSYKAQTPYFERASGLFAASA